MPGWCKTAGNDVEDDIIIIIDTQDDTVDINAFVQEAVGNLGNYDAKQICDSYAEQYGKCPNVIKDKICSKLEQELKHKYSDDVELFEQRRQQLGY
eukprot:258981_1